MAGFRSLLLLVGSMHNPADVRVHRVAVVGPDGIELGGACNGCAQLESCCRVCL